LHCSNISSVNIPLHRTINCSFSPNLIWFDKFWAIFAIKTLVRWLFLTLSSSHSSFIFLWLSNVGFNILRKIIAPVITLPLSPISSERFLVTLNIPLISLGMLSMNSSVKNFSFSNPSVIFFKFSKLDWAISSFFFLLSSSFSPSSVSILEGSISHPLGPKFAASSITVLIGSDRNCLPFILINCSISLVTMVLVRKIVLLFDIPFVWNSISSNSLTISSEVPIDSLRKSIFWTNSSISLCWSILPHWNRVRISRSVDIRFKNWS